MATEYVEYNGQHTGEQIDAALTTVGQLKTVATSGSYNDLTNKPTIPAAANNATLTIQKNGVTAGTFTADASTDKTINLSIPTTASDISALPASTKYAGASTAGGAATSAAKLNTNAGSATQPVYFSGGVPVAGTYSLNKTVPSDAVFTDTTYESKSAASGGTDISLVTTGEKYTWNNKQSALTFDDSPTSGSNNPVKSGGIYTALDGKVDTVNGKGLSTNDYTTAEKNKLAGLSGEDIFVLGDELASNSDLNGLTTPGCWRATTAAIATTISNIPADVTTTFFGATIPSITGSRYIQILVPNDDTGDWYKRRYTGSWQTWVKYKPDPTTQLAENVDLDSLTTEGIWYGYNVVGNSAQHLPVPNGNFNIRVENVMIGAVYLRQTCYIARIQNVYSTFVRVKNLSSGGAWQPWEMVNAVGERGWDIAKNTDLNDLTTPGIYHCTGSSVGSTLSNSPTENPYRMTVSRFTSDSNYIQEIVSINNTTDGYPEVYRRIKLSSGWKPWHKFTGTAVT